MVYVCVCNCDTNADWPAVWIRFGKLAYIDIFLILACREFFANAQFKYNNNSNVLIVS